jgi:hypothetical protein
MPNGLDDEACTKMCVCVCVYIMCVYYVCVEKRSCVDATQAKIQVSST